MGTVQPRFTDTCLIRTPRYYEHFLWILLCPYSVAGPDLEKRRGGGGGSGLPKKFSSGLRASVWSENKGGPRLDPPLVLMGRKEKGCETRVVYHLQNVYGKDFKLTPANRT